MSKNLGRFCLLTQEPEGFQSTQVDLMISFSFRRTKNLITMEAVTESHADQLNFNQSSFSQIFKNHSQSFRKGIPFCICLSTRVDFTLHTAVTVSLQSTVFYIGMLLLISFQISR